MRNKTAAMIAVLILAVGSLAGCAGSSPYNRSDSAYYESTASTATTSATPSPYSSGQTADFSAERVSNDTTTMAEDAMETTTGEIAETSPETTEVVEQKIVTTISMSLETLEFDQAVDQIDAMTKESGGYFESSQITGKNLYDSSVYSRRSASYTILVPTSASGTYLQQLKDSFNVVSTNETSENITATYYDTQAQLQSLEERKARLEAMLADATDLEYMFSVEREIADVTADINYYYTQMQLMDTYVSMTTIYVSLQEVSDYEDPTPIPTYTFGEEISRAFQSAKTNFSMGMQDFAIFVVRHFIGIIIFLVIVVAVILIIRRANKKHKKKLADWKASNPTYIPPTPPQTPPPTNVPPTPPTSPTPVTPNSPSQTPTTPPAAKKDAKPPTKNK